MNTLCEPDWYWCWPLIGRKWSRDLDAGLWLAVGYCVSLSVKVSFCECLSNDRHFILKFTRSISAAWCLYKSFQVSNATCHSMQLSPAGVVGRWFECLDMIFVIIRLLDMKWCCISQWYDCIQSAFISFSGRYFATRSHGWHLTNQRPVFRSRDHSRPIRGQ